MVNGLTLTAERLVSAEGRARADVAVQKIEVHSASNSSFLDMKVDCCYFGCEGTKIFLMEKKNQTGKVKIAYEIIHIG
jgi:hypothetical protein